MGQPLPGCSLGFQQPDDLGVAACPGVRERRHAVAIGEVDIRAVLDQQSHDLLVGRAPIGQDDRLEQRGPAKPVDVVHVDVGLREEIADHLDVAALRGRDQRHAAEPVGQGWVCARLVDDPQDVEEALGTRIQERVVKTVVADVDVRLRVHQRPHRCYLPGNGCRHHRRASVGVAGVDRKPLGQEPLDGWHMAVTGGGVELEVGGHRAPIMLPPMTSDHAPRRNYPPADVPPMDLAQVVRLTDFEAPARDRMHPAAWAYYAGGAYDEHVLRDAAAAWDAFRLRPRVLTDVSSIDLATTILGRPAAMPVGIAPAALHGLAHPDGELATARAATRAGAIQVVSTVASHTIEAVAEVAPGGRRWFQLYVQRDRSVTRDLVQRAAAAGYEALCVTVDLPVLGYRDEVLRMGFNPGEDAYANLPQRDVWRTDGRLDEQLDMRSVGLTWDTLAEIRSWAPLPLVLKGILTPEDARLGVEHGADAIWVSNHGGRQLDRVAAGIDVLESIVDAVEGRAEVYLDGGIRRGPDILIALALGARAVFIARPFLWALACGGEAGVSTAFDVLREELERGLALMGVGSPRDLVRSHVGAAPGLSSGG